MRHCCTSVIIFLFLFAIGQSAEYRNDDLQFTMQFPDADGWSKLTVYDEKNSKISPPLRLLAFSEYGADKRIAISISAQDEGGTIDQKYFVNGLVQGMTKSGCSNPENLTVVKERIHGVPSIAIKFSSRINGNTTYFSAHAFLANRLSYTVFGLSKSSDLYTDETLNSYINSFKFTKKPEIIYSKEVRAFRTGYQLGILFFFLLCLAVLVIIFWLLKKIF